MYFDIRSVVDHFRDLLNLRKRSDHDETKILIFIFQAKIKILQQLCPSLLLKAWPQLNCPAAAAAKEATMRNVHAVFITLPLSDCAVSDSFLVSLLLEQIKQMYRVTKRPCNKLSLILIRHFCHFNHLP